mmetsp:Transcript_21561/g.44982  ORF Transcript_21561/g.44982 Transcript_21561/m.44982 type:complete len:205 (+) Transcript_21561:365-979(+)
MSAMSFLALMNCSSGVSPAFDGFLAPADGGLADVGFSFPEMDNPERAWFTGALMVLLTPLPLLPGLPPLLPNLPLLPVLPLLEPLLEPLLLIPVPPRLPVLSAFLLWAPANSWRSALVRTGFTGRALESKDGCSVIFCRAWSFWGLPMSARDLKTAALGGPLGGNPLLAWYFDDGDMLRASFASFSRRSMYFLRTSWGMARGEM